MSRLEIEADPSAMTITVGPKVFREPELMRRHELDHSVKDEITKFPGLPEIDLPAYDWTFLSEKAAEYEALGRHRDNHLLRIRIKFYTERLGPKFNRRFQAANYWLWLGNRMTQCSADMLRHSGKQWRSYDKRLVMRANQAIGHVNEAERDGLFHLIPAIVIFGKSPHDIRQDIGPAAWRRIANNSRTCNKRIMQACMGLAGEEAESFVKLLDCPSGHLGGIGKSFAPITLEDELIASRLALRKTVAELEHARHLVADAIRMGVQVNALWSRARLQREHDQAAREIRSRQFSPKPFGEPWSFARDGFTATLLTSRLEIVMEGDAQHHCVGSYASVAADGNYAVLRIEGRERATAGLIPVPSGWAVDQVYGACNGRVTEACKKFSAVAARAYGASDLQVAA